MMRAVGVWCVLQMYVVGGRVDIEVQDIKYKIMPDARLPSLPFVERSSTSHRIHQGRRIPIIYNPPLPLSPHSLSP